MTILSLDLDVKEIRGRTLILYLPFLGKDGSEGMVEGMFVVVTIEDVEVVYIAPYYEVF
jgi:hypothetical protein